MALLRQKHHDIGQIIDAALFITKSFTLAKNAAAKAYLSMLMCWFLQPEISRCPAILASSRLLSS
jgi:hypothetical protein